MPPRFAYANQKIFPTRQSTRNSKTYILPARAVYTRKSNTFSFAHRTSPKARALRTYQSIEAYFSYKQMFVQASSLTFSYCEKKKEMFVLF